MILAPCIVGLMVLLVIAIWQVGSFAVEYFTERHRQKANIPIMIQEIHWESWAYMTAYVEESRLLPY